jgi:integrase
LTPRHVTAHIKPSWSPSTERSYIKTILACLNRAVNDGLIEENLIKNIEMPAWERREKILTGDELAKLMEAAKEPFKTLLVAMCESRCRPSEICGLKVEDCFLIKTSGWWRTKRRIRPA